MTRKLAATVNRNCNETSTHRLNGHKRGRCNSTRTSVKSCMWATGTKEPYGLQHVQPPTRGSGRGKVPGSADPPNTISQQQLCCGGQESEPDGRTHLQNCDTQERTNCCTTVQGTSETTSGVLLTSLVTLSKEGHSKHRKSSTKSGQNDSLDICPNIRRTPEVNGTDITGEPPTQG